MRRRLRRQQEVSRVSSNGGGLGLLAEVLKLLVAPVLETAVESWLRRW